MKKAGQMPGLLTLRFIANNAIQFAKHSEV
jgi:hypothetical protein